jgi:hypothetical protein
MASFRQVAAIFCKIQPGVHFAVLTVGVSQFTDEMDPPNLGIEGLRNLGILMFRRIIAS